MLVTHDNLLSNVNYAGGVRSIEDLNRVRELGRIARTSPQAATWASSEEPSPTRRLFPGTAPIRIPDDPDFSPAFEIPENRSRHPRSWYLHDYGSSTQKSTTINAG